MEPESFAGLPAAIATGLGVFFACITSFNKWVQLQKTEVTQITIITEDRNRWQARAERAEQVNEEYREKLNQIIIDQSEMKAQNAMMIEQIKNLREDNERYQQEILGLTRGTNVQSITRVQS